MVLILEPVTTDVKNINMIGRILIANKKSNFLSLRLNLNLIFLTSSQTKIKKGMSIPICFIKKNEWIFNMINYTRLL